MSTEEIDKALGRLIREKGEHKRKLAALDAELRQVAHHIKSVADAISQRCEVADKKDGTRLSPLGITMDAERYVDMETVNRLLAEQQQAYDDYTSADKGVSRFSS